MLAGLGEPGDGVDTDQAAPGTGLASGADDHAQAERDQGDGHGQPQIDDYFGCAAHKSGGCAERRVHNESAQERLPQLIGVGGTGQATAGTPCQQKRDEGQTQRNQRQQSRPRLRSRGANVYVSQFQRHPVDQQPGLAAQPRKGVHGAVLETVCSPHSDERKHHNNGRNERCLGRFQPALQPKGHREATVSGLISAQFHRVQSCHDEPLSPVRRP
ncbi:hypothetical protein PJL18_02807 [Paenarthrobacter nicotinovorans]|nr:hypothetical protein [Paenarthrobacter nicotinovorans]